MTTFDVVVLLVIGCGLVLFFLGIMEVNRLFSKNAQDTIERNQLDHDLTQLTEWAVSVELLHIPVLDQIRTVKLGWYLFDRMDCTWKRESLYEPYVRGEHGGIIRRIGVHRVLMLRDGDSHDAITVVGAEHAS